MVRQQKKTRNCLCENYGIVYSDLGECDGESEEIYQCPGTLPWNKIPDGDPCSDTEIESCSPFEVQQTYKCMCQDGNNYEIDDNTELCDGDPTPTTCSPNGEYHWSDWETVTDCSYCYPELDQTQVRECVCGDKVDHTQCSGPERQAESCPEPAERRWFPTEWVEFPCDALMCNKDTFTTKERTCQCEGNKDTNRCDENMFDTVPCGRLDYELTEWSDPTCDDPICHPYTKTKRRTCTCTDGEGESTDLSQCDATPFGYEQDIQCPGDDYTWGAWQSRGCPTDSCFQTKTKRYRVCECHGDVDFNKCEGNAIDFPFCELPAFCGPAK